jgi:hypothetical protein
MPILRAAPASSHVVPAELPADPRFAVVAGEAGYRAIITTFIKSAWPYSTIEEVDPFSQTLLGLGVTLRDKCDAIVVAGLGTLNEAQSAMQRLGAGSTEGHLPPVIMLVADDLIEQTPKLLAAGAGAVFHRDALSRATLLEALAGFAPERTRTAPRAFRTAQDRMHFGAFEFQAEGERIRLLIEQFRPVAPPANHTLARVFLSERISDGTRVVVKIGTDTPYHDSALARKFCGRYAFLTSRTGGGIVRYLDAGIAGSWPYVVIEYLGETDLRARLGAALEPIDAIRIIQRILTALDELHSGKIAHLDLKPENIFFRADGSVVLIDFNISAAFGDLAKNVAPGEFLATPYYMSPEQARNQPVDGRADLYALGVILYEMLAGERPFQGDNSVQVIFKHLHDEVPLLPRRMRGLQPVVDALLAKDRADRPADIAALQSMLAPFTANPALAAGTD